MSWLSKKHKLIDIGKVSLKDVSPYLASIDENASAKLLVSPVPTIDILGTRGVKHNWFKAVQQIHLVDETHQVKYKGSSVIAMDLDEDLDLLMEVEGEHYETPEPFVYQEAVSKKLQEAFNKAVETGKDQVTGLFLPTFQMVVGLETERSGDKVVENNIIDKKDTIRLHRALNFSQKPSDMHGIWTSSEAIGRPDCKLVAGLRMHPNRNRDEYSSLPVALKILAP